jgi:hypothetical protein
MAENRKTGSVRNRRSEISKKSPATKAEAAKKGSPVKRNALSKNLRVSDTKKKNAQKKVQRHLHLLGLPAGEAELARLVVGLPSQEPVDPLADLGELPESYGTRRIYALARDPEWIFVYWDWTYEQLEDLRRSTPEGKVFVRLVRENSEMLQQALVEGGVRDWFFHYKEPGARIRAELGVYVDENFQVAASSSVSEIPRLSAAPGPVRYATVPLSITFAELARLVEFHRLPGERLLETLARLQQIGFVFPFEVLRRAEVSASQWAKLVDEWEEEFRKVIRVGSEEIVKTWKIRHGVFREEESLGEKFDQAPSSQAPSSWGGGSESAFKPREFFMHVNAELIIYGGTDPRARVRIDGKDIKLAPDGTFYYHFVFPDGAFHIPISATSPDEVETRSAMLSFLRLTEKSGDVKDTDQPKHLGEPLGKVKR